MKLKKFFDIHHAQMYLMNSLIRYKDKPVIVHDIQFQQNGKLAMRYAANHDMEGYWKTASLSSKFINMNPVPLGLVNFGRRCIFIARAPLRAWKVGLTANAMFMYSADPNDRALGINPNAIFRSKELADTIAGNYPDLENALEEFQSDDHVIGISRHFAVSKKSLYFQNAGVVGQVKDSSVKLNPQFDFLQEMLEMDMAHEGN